MEIRLKSQFSPKSVASSDFWNCFPYEVRKLLERRQESGRICCRELSDIVELDGDRKPRSMVASNDNTLCVVWFKGIWMN